ncbi:YHS domain-containing protein [[Leptolyngbya] sp. PCC 7376]|uniref:YHS domain-containing (seleno)protein n=1 Tax=[Leptolyngbya] sp. PCC 7376 TaxID=111781 RepID=UPI00029F0529|nr:YHS domain-containing (seleno)protein [[Leptolyngbya] sp. PCC 7376]AFY39444.1 YHS domain-containing protein [[Leptolyngbya] sp. PCC 7376]
MAIKNIKIPSLLLSFAAIIALTGCGEAEQTSETIQTDSSTEQTETIEPSAANYSVNIDEKGRALRGNDPVAYFTNNEPVVGNQEFSFRWNDAEYYFATAENRDEFISDPEKYAPANGGYCTFGVVLAKKFDGDPEVWSVHNDRLHVFLNQEVKEKFLQDESGNLSRVAEIWPTIRDKSPEELEAS